MDPNISHFAVFAFSTMSCGTQDPPEHNHTLKQVSNIFSLSVPLWGNTGPGAAKLLRNA